MIPERIIPEEIGKSSLDYIEHIARYDFAKRYIKKHMRILDAACGCGYGADALANLNCSVLGIDISDEAINYAKKTLC